MGTVWTAEQQKVIDLRNRNILVSAAAGSGKTAVLVERIIQRITDAREPVDVDRMLIVTFTEAAASEMKERIAAAIEKQLEQRPGDDRLERQAALIHTAPITTIHSFCLSVIRDHFHVIGIDPGFRIVEEGELKLLRQDVLDEMLEECYEKGDERFLAFVEKFGRGRNDRKIEELILKLYEFSCSYPQPGKWLDSCVLAYKGEDLLSSGFVKNAELRARRRGQDIDGILSRALKICEEPDGPYMYADMIESDRKYLDRIVKAENFETMYEAVNGFAWRRLSTKRDETVSAEKKEEVKKLRKQAKKLVEGIQAAYFYAPWQEWAEDEEINHMVFVQEGLPQSRRPRQPRQNAVSGQPSPLMSMWRSVYKFLAGRQALFQANAGDQRLHERFSFRKSIRLFLNIKSVLEKGLPGCLEFIQAGNKGVKGQGCPDPAFCRGC